MHLASPEGSLALELRVLGYQYPGGARDEYDANWLFVAGRVEHPRGNWSFQSACLLTSEAVRLANWLEAVGRGQPSEPELAFIEPCLRFECVSGALGRSVRAYFQLESRPPWAESGLAGPPPCFIEFPVSELPFRRAVESLRQQAARYPERAAR